MINVPAECIIFFSAELLFLIVRSSDIQMLAKRTKQRTKREQQCVERGLLRSVILEIIMFVPASAALLVFVAPVIIPESFSSAPTSQSAFYAMMGIVSYGFPFAILRRLISRMALQTLKEFSELVSKEVKPDED